MSRVLNFVARQDTRAVAAGMNVCRADSPLRAAQIGSPAVVAPAAAYAVRRQAMAASDYTVENKGTLLLLRSTNGKAYEWLVKHTDREAHWFGRALVVEHGYITDFVARLRFDGFTVDDTQA
jgi:hypothetical protein